MATSTFFLTDQTKDNILKHFLRTASWTKPAALWWGLFTVAPTNLGGGTEVATGGGTLYVRIQLNPADASYAAPSTPADGGRITSNSVVITFPNAGADWGNCVAAGVFDASSAGNLLGWMPLTIALFVHAGDVGPSFPIGNLTIELP